MSMSELMRGAMQRNQSKNALDSTSDEPALSGADDYTATDIKMSSVAVIQEWAENDDLGDGENCADRLMAMAVGLADADKDGEISDDEQVVINAALNAMWDYLVALGVSEEDAGSLLNDWDNEAAERVRDFVASVLPDGDEEASAAIDRFVFSKDDQSPALDGAVYRKTLAVRNGKRVRINKRISGVVRLSPRQKLALRKARMKSHSAGAMSRRMRSMRLVRR